MADDKPTLTRRRVLGGMATIGVAGALGAGTWAQFSDTESADVTVTAGTLDLTVDGQDISGYDVTIGPVVPGGGGTIRTVTLKNQGNVPGKLGVEFSSITDEENGRNEPEKRVDKTTDDGELDDVLTFTADVAGGGSYTFSPSDVANVDYTSGIVLGEDESKDVTFSYSVSDNAGNGIQSDKLSFGITFTLNQA